VKRHGRRRRYITRLIAREIRQPPGREAVGGRSCVAPAAVDILRATAELAMTLPSPDTSPSW